MGRIQDLNDILYSTREVCKLYTSHKWSNSWEDGYKYMFLVYGDGNEFSYDDISGLDIKIHNRDGLPRVDIRQRSPLNLHSFFFISNSIQLSSIKSYIMELIINSYNNLCFLRNKLDMIKDCYGEYPHELIAYQREEILNNLLNDGDDIS